MKPLFKNSILLVTVLIGAILFISAISFFASNILMVLTSIVLIVSAVSFAFTSSTELVQARVVTSQMSSLTLALNKSLKEAGYEGKIRFLPPRLLGEQPVQLIGNKSIVPTGLHLESIFEKEAGLDFFSIDLKQLEELLVKVVVDKLEIADELRIKISKESSILVQMKNFAQHEFYANLQQASSIDSLSLDPTVSALACSFTKAAKKSVWIEKFSIDNRDVKIEFGFN